VARSTKEVDVIDPEGAVRLYLLWLENPDQLVDRAKIAKLESDYGKAKDPIERLRLLGHLDKARVADGAQLEADFVRLAGSWAATNAVPANAFRQLGVSEDLLVAAGIDVGASRRRGRGRGGRSAAARTTGSGTALRAKAVSSETLRAWMLQRSEPFTVAEATGAVGGSPMTVKKALDELIETGRVERLGPVSGWTGRGRAPNAYRLVSGKGQS
jgi:hypothetical protein